MAPSLGVPSTPPLTPTSTASNNALISPPRPQSTASAQAARAGATSPTPLSRYSFSPSLQYPLVRASSTVHSRTTSMHLPSHRAMTPSARSGTPAISTSRSSGSESTTTKPRRLSLSVPPPPKMIRSSSSSDEKEREKQRAPQQIKRWIPFNEDADTQTSATATPDRSHSQTPARFRATATPLPPSRAKTPFSVHSP